MSTLGGFNLDILANPVVLDRLIEWKLASPRSAMVAHEVYGTPISKEQKMQRQFTIELRVDYADNEKNESMRKALQHCARHAFATASLLTDGVKPQVAIFSDDFFSGHEEIVLMDDVIQQGLDETGDTKEVISNELLGAMTGAK